MKLCEEYASLLDPMLDGALDAAEAARVRAHLSVCPACAAYMEDAAALRSAFGSVEEVQPPDGFADGVMAAVRAGGAPRKQTPGRRVRALASLAACAAVVLAAAHVTTTAPLSAASAEAAPAEAVEAAGAIDTAEPAEPKSFALDSCAEDENGVSAAQSSLTLASSGTSAEDAGSTEARRTIPEELSALDDLSGVRFARVVFLAPETAGAALDGYEGLPYAAPSGGPAISGAGYALEAADFVRILEEIGYSGEPTLDPARTTELCCIIVVSAGPAEN